MKAFIEAAHQAHHAVGREKQHEQKTERQNVPAFCMYEVGDEAFSAMRYLPAEWQ
jgi:hypothetical protein